MNKLIHYRYAFVALTLIILTVSLLGFRSFTFDTSPRVFFKPGNVDYERVVNMEDTYGSDYTIFIMMSARSGDMFEKEKLQALMEITKLGWELPFVRRVDSLANYQYIHSQNDEMLVEDFIDDIIIDSTERLNQRKGFAITDPDVVHRLISTDAKHASISLSLNMDGPTSQHPDGGHRVIELMYDLSNRIEEKYPGVEMSVSGGILSTYHNMKVAEADGKSLVPLLFIIMFVLVGVLLRSPASIAVALVVAVFSCIGALGFSSLLGLVFSPLAVNAALISITVAVAHCVHILVGLMNEMRTKSKAEALEVSLSKNYKAVTITSLTTAIGFLSLNTNDLPPIAVLGNAAAIGAFLSWLYSMTLLPALVMLLPIKPSKEKSTYLQTFMLKLADLIIARKGWVLATTFLTIIIMGWFSLQNKMNDNLAHILHEPHTFRTDTAKIDQHFGSILVNNYELDSGEEYGITNPDYLNYLDRFSSFLREQPEITNVYSFSDVMKRLNQSMHNDDSAFYSIPEDKALISQYLLLYELSLPFGLDLNERITHDKRKTLVTVSMPSLETEETIEIEARIRAWQIENLPKDLFAHNISLGTIWSHLTLASAKNSIEGALIALSIISFILLFVLKSFRYGLISLIPNITPVMLGFGLWYFFSGQIGLALSCVVILTIGIVVDDTVHFLVKYQAAKKETGDTEEAIRATFRDVGPALVVTTLILTSGFAVLAFSQIMMNSALGQMTSMILVSALVLDFLLLPSLILVLGKRFNL